LSFLRVIYSTEESEAMYVLVGNWKQWKREPEMENENGQSLMQMNARVKPLINDHLLKTISVQRPPLYKDHLSTKTLFTSLPLKSLFLRVIACYMWSDVK